MPQFSYKAKDTTGQTVNGVLEAESSTVAVSRLQQMGFFPLNVQDAKSASADAGAAVRRRAKSVKINDMATFNRQLADLLSSGIPLVKALSVIQNQTPNPTLVEVITQITQDVSGGDSLAGAMSKHPKIFSKLYVAMVRSGEAGGLLDQVLQRLADFAESEAETRSKIKSALAYPMVMVLAGSGAVIVLMTVVMPKILKIYSDLNQTLPMTTQFLIFFSDALRSYWYFFIGALVALVFAFRRMAATAEGKKAIDAFVVKIPILGAMIVKKEIANFARTLGSLLHNGVSILSALEITIEVLTNRTVADEVSQIPLNVTQGEGIAAPLRKSKVFPPVVVNMMAIGEETGRLDDVLMKIARSFDTEVDRGMKTLTSLLEPMVILVMGIVVGFIVISMLLPIFSIDPGA
ncbi:MAG: type II secretion system F family protein [Candidatus Sumerlaeaceae bacterium]